MLKHSEKAIEDARNIHLEVAHKVSSALNLYGKDQAALLEIGGEESVPVILSEIGKFLANGYVSFDIELQELLNEQVILELEEVLKKSRHPLLKAAGWVFETEDEGILLGLDEMWIDPEAKFASSMLEGGLQTVLVSRPGTGVMFIRVEASGLFMRQGWRIVPQDRFDVKSQEAYQKYNEYKEEEAMREGVRDNRPDQPTATFEAL